MKSPPFGYDGDLFFNPLSPPHAEEPGWNRLSRSDKGQGCPSASPG